MKKIKVLVKDKNTLLLEEDANKGDYIDLADLSSVDMTSLESLINSEKNSLLNERIEEIKKSEYEKLKLELEKQKALFDSEN